ncbi:MAG: ribosome recycling factor [Alphaproteobacteria bacterium]|nr:ribosome recycling factor [Alphaproteobacteria bacterium]
MVALVLTDLEKRMKSGIESLKKEFTGLRAGRASASMLDPIMVDAYGSMMPLSQVGTVTTPEPRLISVQVWDKGMSKAVEKAIRESGLGLNPIGEGQIIRVPLPELSEERRKELSKVASKYAEAARIAIRNVRRDGMETLKKMEKDGDISEDEHKKTSVDVQKLTDKFIEQVDVALVAKEKEIMQV